MILNNDRAITISAAGNRKSLSWPQQVLWWSEFVESLKTPVRSKETFAEYLRLSKGEQDNLKDVGGFVGGAVNGRRKACNVISRDLITLDMDNIPHNEKDSVLRRLNALSCAYAVYSTRKHEPTKPRLRAIFPLDRPITADEYEPIARKVAEILDISLCDPTTFDVSRLMYRPSCCADGEYVLEYSDSPFISADGLLGMYVNWRDVSSWPQVPGTAQTHAKLVSRQGDPTSKQGVVGAFCKTYDIYRALTELIPEAYTPCADGRYTYAGGSTIGGAVVYDNGAFLYSHHATDPASGKLCNSFDLVRLHKFGHTDADAKADTPTNKLPSYAAMCEYAVADKFVSSVLNTERYENANADLMAVGQETDAANWISQLQVSPSTGAPAKTIKNVQIVLENDINLKGKILYDEFSEAIVAKGALPWPPREHETGMYRWTDTDDAGLRGYIEQVLGFRGRDLAADAFVLSAAKNSFNPLYEYLTQTPWDRVPRLDSLFIDYLGAEDSEYTRAITRKAFVAAVARALQPGIKFDTMLVIHGRQGLGKSTLLSKMGVNWFSDSLKTFDGKEAAELLQGVWIVEIGELEAYGKSDVRAVKSFLSKCDDQYRAAYAKRTEKHLRKCVFFGTTNDHNYLRDTTGNRRFWPLDAGEQPPSKNLFTHLTFSEIRQIWSEALFRYNEGESLILPSNLEEVADLRRASHFDRDPIQGQIEDFLDTPVPIDWQKWDANRRQLFWYGGIKYDGATTLRDRVCVAEIWRECLNGKGGAPKQEAHRINNALEGLAGWERASTARFGGGYGTQKGFRRVQNSIENV